MEERRNKRKEGNSNGQLYWKVKRTDLPLTAEVGSTPSSYCVQIIIVKMVYSVLFSNTFKVAYSCSFRFGGNLDFPDFLQNKFYNIDYCSSGYG